MKEKKEASIISRVAFVAAGLFCIINGVMNTEAVVKYFPLIISVVMIASGIYMFLDSYSDFKARSKKDSNRIARSLMLVLVGILTMCQHGNEMPFIGVVWGLIGLSKAEDGVAEILVGSFKVRKTVLILLESFIELILSLMLLFEPVDSVGHHVVILGFQIIAFGLFKMDSESDIKDLLYEIQNK